MPFISTTDPAWKSLLEEAPYDFYHLPGYDELDAALIGGEPVGWFYEKSGLRALIPLIKRTIPSNGFDLISPYGYPGMLTNKDIAGDKADVVFKAFHNDALQAGAVSSFIRLNPFLNDWDLENWQMAVIGKLGEIVPLDSNYVTALHGYTAAVNLRRGVTPYSMNHKRNLAQLHEEGYTVDLNNWDDMPRFIKAYRQTMKRHHANAYYCFPDSYFNELLAMTGENRLMLITVRSPDGHFLGGGLFTMFNSIIQYHLGATMDKAVSHSPLKLAIEKAVETGKEKKARWLHLGGGVGADTKSGLYRFKKGFAENNLPFRCLHFIHQYDKYESLCRKVGTIEQYIKGERSFFPLYRQE